MTKLRTLKLFNALAWLLLAASTGARAQLLVTEAEAAAARAAPEPPAARSAPAPGAPRINVLAPDLAGPIASPTRIQLRFEPTAPAAIRPESFRVRYGALRLDITGRITAVSKVAPDGIDVAEAELPKGAHRLLLEIQDSQGRTGERLLQFVVQ